MTEERPSRSARTDAAAREAELANWLAFEPEPEAIPCDPAAREMLARSGIELDAEEETLLARYLGMLTRRGALPTLVLRESLHAAFAGTPVRVVSPTDLPQALEQADLHCPLLDLPRCLDPRGVAIPAPFTVATPAAGNAALREVLAGLTQPQPRMPRRDGDADDLVPLRADAHGFLWRTRT